MRSRDHPDGLPADQLDPKHVKELRTANQLLARVAAIAIEARHSPARTTIVFEQPADRSIESSTAYSADLASHGSILATSTFKRLASEAELTHHATFAYCRLLPPPAQQKYTTLYYSPEAASVLDPLNGPDFQCNHERGTTPRGRFAAPRPAGLCNGNRRRYPGAPSSKNRWHCRRARLR